MRDQGLLKKMLVLRNLIPGDILSSSLDMTLIPVTIVGERDDWYAQFAR